MHGTRRRFACMTQEMRWKIHKLLPTARAVSCPNQHSVICRWLLPERYPYLADDHLQMSRECYRGCLGAAGGGFRYGMEMVSS